MQVQDLSFLVDSMGDSAFSQKFKKLSRSLCEVSVAIRELSITSHSGGEKYAGHGFTELSGSAI